MSAPIAGLTGSQNVSNGSAVITNQTVIGVPDVGWIGFGRTIYRQTPAHQSGGISLSGWEIDADERLSIFYNYLW